MNESNELLRSAYQIALREGKDTNWEAFKQNVKTELTKAPGIDPSSKQQVLRATITPRTFRI
ncbi:hypothetical protein KAR91_68235 [Candidatus Pacearchaeota archaeon]|nr:hypothetical protein [Candidatus Pacearchaeota archaeon]